MMPSADQVVEWALLLGAGGLMLEAFRSFRDRRNRKADYSEVIARSAMVLLEPLESRIRELESEVVEVKKELRKAREETAFWKAEAQAERRRFHKEREEGS